MLVDKELQNVEMKGCLIVGHHLSPYDIKQTIFDSIKNNATFHAHYIENIN